MSKDEDIRRDPDRTRRLRISHDDYVRLYPKERIRSWPKDYWSYSAETATEMWQSDVTKYPGLFDYAGVHRPSEWRKSLIERLKHGTPEEQEIAKRFHDY